MAAERLPSKINSKIITILIIEDSDINSAVLKHLLEQSGLKNIIIAKSGKEAIHYFSENIDLIFMDLNLHDSDGFKLTQIYRKELPKKDTPIICWSTDADSKWKECIEAGMDDFLSKPVSPEKLQEILECWLPSYLWKLESNTD